MSWLRQICLPILLICVSMIASAQSAGSLKITVTDDHDRILMDAVVALRSGATVVEKRADETGIAKFDGLDEKLVYVITVQKPGFAKFELRDIRPSVTPDISAV